MKIMSFNQVNCENQINFGRNRRPRIDWRNKDIVSITDRKKDDEMLCNQMIANNQNLNIVEKAVLSMVVKGYKTELPKSTILKRIFEIKNDILPDNVTTLNSKDMLNYFDLTSGQTKDTQLAVLDAVDQAKSYYDLDLDFMVFRPMKRHPKLINAMRDAYIAGDKLSPKDEFRRKDAIYSTFSILVENLGSGIDLADSAKTISNKLFSFKKEEAQCGLGDILAEKSKEIKNHDELNAYISNLTEDECEEYHWNICFGK